METSLISLTEEETLKSTTTSVTVSQSSKPTTCEDEQMTQAGLHGSLLAYC